MPFAFPVFRVFISYSFHLTPIPKDSSCSMGLGLCCWAASFWPNARSRCTSQSSYVIMVLKCLKRFIQVTGLLFQDLLAGLLSLFRCCPSQKNQVSFWNFVRLWCFPMFSHAMGKVMLSDFAHAQVMTPSWLVQKFSQNHGRRLQLWVFKAYQFVKVSWHARNFRLPHFHRIISCFFPVRGLWDRLPPSVLRSMESVCGGSWPRSRCRAAVTPLSHVWVIVILLRYWAMIDTYRRRTIKTDQQCVIVRRWQDTVTFCRSSFHHENAWTTSCLPVYHHFAISLPCRNVVSCHALC